MPTENSLIDLDMDDDEAILHIVNLFGWYQEVNVRLNDQYRWRGMDGPKYPEIREEYEKAKTERDNWKHLLVLRINEYIDSRIKKALNG